MPANPLYLIYGRQVCCKAGNWILCTMIGYRIPEQETFCMLPLISFRILAQKRPGKIMLNKMTKVHDSSVQEQRCKYIARTKACLEFSLTPISMPDCTIGSYYLCVPTESISLIPFASCMCNIVRPGRMGH